MVFSFPFSLLASSLEHSLGFPLSLYLYLSYSLLGPHSLSKAMFVLHFLYLARSYLWNVGNVRLTFLALCDSIVHDVCVCVGGGGDHTLCMVDSHGYVSDYH